MRKALAVLAFSMAGCLTLSSLPAAAGEQEEREAFDAYLDEVFADLLETSPFNVHFVLQNPEKYGISITDYVLDDYTDYDEAALEQYWKNQEESHQKLQEFDKTLLTQQQQLLYDKLAYEWDFSERYQDVPDYSSRIGGDSGLVNTIANNFYNYLFLEKKDVEDYLKFLEDIPNEISFCIDITNEQSKEGFVPSKYMLQANIEAVDVLCTGETNVFLEGFETKINEAEFLTAEEKESFINDNRETVDSIVTPAFQTLKETLQDWEENLEEWDGLYSMEGGTSYYEYLAEMYTGSSMSVDEMYSYLEDKLYTYSRQLSDLLEDEEVLDRYMNWDYGFDDSTPEEILDTLRANTKESFPAIEDPGYSISELPMALRSSGILAYYLAPQEDNDTVNMIRTNPDALGDDLGILYATLAHEGYPGHLYYYNYIKQQGWHPLNSQLMYLGYTEGWADYVGLNSLYEWDMYDHMAEVIIADEEISYILLGLTDIGVNCRGWTLDDVFELWNAYFYLDNKEDIRDIYNASVADPASILSYPMGYLQIVDLEESVREVLGASYDQKEFEEAFLSVGGAPFSITEEYVMNWANEKAGTAAE